MILSTVVPAHAFTSPDRMEVDKAVSASRPEAAKQQAIVGVADAMDHSLDSVTSTHPPVLSNSSWRDAGKSS